MRTQIFSFSQFRPSFQFTQMVIPSRKKIILQNNGFPLSSPGADLIANPGQGHGSDGHKLRVLVEGTGRANRVGPCPAKIGVEEQHAGRQIHVRPSIPVGNP